MSTFFMILVMIGSVFLFALVKTGMRLMYPFAICVLARLIGMVLFIWTSIDPIAADVPAFALHPAGVAAILIIATAGIGVLLLGVVVVARWFGGEYQSVKEGQAHE